MFFLLPFIEAIASSFSSAGATVANITLSQGIVTAFEATVTAVASFAFELERKLSK